jgi:hypothetical protein
MAFVDFSLVRCGCDLCQKNGASEQKCEERRMRVCAWNALPPSAAPT